MYISLKKGIIVFKLWNIFVESLDRKNHREI